MADTAKELRVLVLAPLPADENMLLAAAEDSGHDAVAVEPCQLAGELTEGAGALLVTEDALTSEVLANLTGWSDGQPDWSAVPLIVLVRSPGRMQPALREVLGEKENSYTTLLDRPVAPWVLRNALQAALQNRRRQYRIRDQLLELDQQREITELLAREIQHRAKNNLAILQALLWKLSRRARSPQELFTRFETRADALARGLDLLNSRQWRGLTLHDLVKAVAEDLTTDPSQSFRCSGERLVLNSEAIAAMHLVFHELATNALKYGALSNSDGYIAVSWSKDVHEKGPLLYIDWTEHGGPTVDRPYTEGFGSYLVDLMIQRKLGGTATLAFEQEGVRCHIELPLKNALAAA